MYFRMAIIFTIFLYNFLLGNSEAVPNKNGSCGYIFILDVKPPLLVDLGWNTLLNERDEIIHLQNEHVGKVKPTLQIHIRQLNASILIRGYNQNKTGENGKRSFQYSYDSEIASASVKLQADEFIESIVCEPYILNFENKRSRNNCLLEIPPSEDSGNKSVCAFLYSERDCRQTSLYSDRLIIYPDEIIPAIPFTLRSLVVNPNCVLYWISADESKVIAKYRNTVDEFQYGFQDQTFQCVCHSTTFFEPKNITATISRTSIDVAPDLMENAYEKRVIEQGALYYEGYHWGAFFTGVGTTLVLTMSMAVIMFWEQTGFLVRRLRSGSRIFYDDNEECENWTQLSQTQ